MSEQITRVSLAEAIEGDRTDWNRIRTLSDAEIDRAIATDPDTFAVDPAVAHFVLLKNRSDEWRWRLISENGEILADGNASYANRMAAIAAINDLRRAIAGSKTDIAA